jgi:hypothetical protein
MWEGSERWGCQDFEFPVLLVLLYVRVANLFHIERVGPCHVFRRTAKPARRVRVLGVLVSRVGSRIADRAGSQVGQMVLAKGTKIGWVLGPRRSASFIHKRNIERALPWLK